MRVFNGSSTVGLLRKLTYTFRGMGIGSPESGEYSY